MVDRQATLDLIRQELAGRNDRTLLPRLPRAAIALDVLLPTRDSSPPTKTTATLLYDNGDGQRIVHLSDIQEASGQFAIVRNVPEQPHPVVTYRDDTFSMVTDCL